MAYTKPVIIAQNNASGSYAAGCPATRRSNGNAVCGGGCSGCEISY